ncbi:MAG: SDR family NAD(P)-dependent oxidoreductase [Alphaproteobacteria bacterium]|nr:SDR family NAD(P)-dependent oxidoreductase [Alphaproteobacteria bacterium]
MQNPKHIAITGASSGLGAALALAYGYNGTVLSLHGRDAQRLAHVADRVRAHGATVDIHSGDVTDAAGQQAWLTARAAIAPLDLVIANAGISAGTGSGGENREQAAAIFSVNVQGVVNTVHAALPAMRARGKGQIALMASLAGFRGLPSAPAYSASKAAVRLYGEALRGELMATGIEVSVICPGYIKTPMTAVNKFPMPFIMSAEKAARIIQLGLAQNRARIAFPFPLYAAVKLLATLPPAWTDGFMARLPKKP